MRKAPLIRVMVVGMVFLAAAPAGNGRMAPAPGKKLARRGARLPARPYQVGRATWYGEKFHGRLTATGEQFDMFQLTAAHRLLPVGSLVRVTHLGSRRSVVVRINDRGPVQPHTIIDLSYAAARQLGVVRQGCARVRLDLVRRGSLPGQEDANTAAGQE